MTRPELKAELQEMDWKDDGSIKEILTIADKFQDAAPMGTLVYGDVLALMNIMMAEYGE